jgi:hypothetical protein
MLLASISNSLEIEFGNKFSKDNIFPSLKTVWQGHVREFILQESVNNLCRVLAMVDSPKYPLWYSIDGGTQIKLG